MSKDPNDRKNYMGIWTAIHILGKSRNDLRQVHLQAIIDIALNLGCTHDCVRHAKSFIESTDLEKLLKDPSEYALFDWTVKFHNHANKITGKPEMSLDDARKLYNLPDTSGKTHNTNNTCGKHHGIIIFERELY